MTQTHVKAIWTMPDGGKSRYRDIWMWLNTGLEGNKGTALDIRILKGFF